MDIYLAVRNVSPPSKQFSVVVAGCRFLEAEAKLGLQITEWEGDQWEDCHVPQGRGRSAAWL